MRRRSSRPRRKHAPRLSPGRIQPAGAVPCSGSVHHDLRQGAKLPPLRSGRTGAPQSVLDARFARCLKPLRPSAPRRRPATDGAGAALSAFSGVPALHTAQILDQSSRVQLTSHARVDAGVREIAKFENWCFSQQ